MGWAAEMLSFKKQDDGQTGKPESVLRGNDHQIYVVRLITVIHGKGPGYKDAFDSWNLFEILPYSLGNFPLGPTPFLPLASEFD